MAYIFDDTSRTFGEFQLLPNLTGKRHIPENVNLAAPLVKFREGEEPAVQINLPVAASAMQAVSDDRLATALARAGGIAFIYCSQAIEAQAEMVRKVKNYKSGFVVSDSNLKIDSTVRDMIALVRRTGHSTIPITSDGSPNGRLLGIVTDRDCRPDKVSPETPMAEIMTPAPILATGHPRMDLSAANDAIWKNKVNCLPIVDEDFRLVSLVFRKDYDDHKRNPNELVDAQKRLRAGAAINTHDYKDRVPALIEAGADVLCVDSSDGYSEWQRETLQWIREKYGDSVNIGGGNVVDAQAFRYLADSGADFVKVGVGPGSICITREQKGIGRGQASAVIECALERDKYFADAGVYVPLCSDGGIVYDYNIVLALAMGADFVMMGRYFARCDEAPGKKIRMGTTMVKEYWGEGSSRARNWQRYHEAGEDHFSFEEGVESYVPYAGKLEDALAITVSKVKATMCSCGALTIRELQKTARLVRVSGLSIREGGAHDVIPRDEEYPTYK
ncbi:MAG: IMP dehydrogenase [Candidatus Sumerlaeota bacterium]|nr:IMP dehydrogenase [Candidatus Sumerlaeota bacterium]